MFIGEWNKSVILTYLGMACAVFGMYLAFMGNVHPAFVCLIISGVCDLFDGAVARKCQRTEAQKKFGIQLDSLVDVVSFIALPIMITLSAGWMQWYHIMILIIFGICGIARLAFFNVHTEEMVGFYRGLPVTYTALILPLVYLLSTLLPTGVFRIVYAVAVLGIAFLNILDIKVVKPKGIAYVFFALLAMGSSVVYLAVLP